MKLIIAMVQDKDSNRLSNEFVDSGIRATKSSTTGGFLRAGNTTFIIGIDDERVSEVLNIIRENCQSREQFMTPPVSLDVSMETNMPYPVEVQVGGATVFVMPVEQFEQY
ncbi:cyclic-di-AMP receptor [Carnobacterium mobile]|uniref:cyclic-di-AMP receptor n=1 Tax=Carnobacterium mobile TaxID=2750 RepID=UPI00054E5406|nr:cyclic-di-AMP receptor [Carnobacterium mobile]